MGGRPLRIATLLDWLEHRLPQEEMDAVSHAVEHGDDQLKQTVAWLRDFVETAGRARLEQPPPIVRQRLQEHFRRWTVGAERRPAGPIMVAELVFDSRRDLSYASVRSTGAEESNFHIAFRSTSADLVLDVSPTRDGYVRLDGQLLPFDAAAPTCSAELRTATFSARSVDGDEHGRFGFAEIPAAAGRLTVRSGALTITADVDLDAGP